MLLLEIAKTIGADRRGMIPVGARNATLINTYKGSSAKYGLGRDHLILVGIIAMDGSGDYITWGPNCALEGRTEMSLELKFPAASLGLPR